MINQCHNLVVVPRGGFEPPTRGFSVEARPILNIAGMYNNDLNSVAWREITGQSHLS
jgi:hypothetical protein